MSSNVVSISAGSAEKAIAYLDNANAPKPDGEDFAEAMKTRLQDVLLPISEVHRYEFIQVQVGEMDALLNKAIKEFATAALAQDQMEKCQEQISYTILALVVPGDMQYVKPTLKLAQVSSKVAKAIAIWDAEGGTLEKYRKARTIVSQASSTLAQVVPAIGYQQDRTISD